MAGILTMIRSGFSTENYYTSMNQALKRLNDEYTMLHYPYHVNDHDDFYTAQKNLTDFCISTIGSIEGKKVLEIGCGNGIQALYIMKEFKPGYIKGVDLNAANIEIARQEARKSGFSNVDFETGDAQDLSKIADNSFDVVVNIESAFHYPNKHAFLNEIARVLKPGGQFLLADILKTPVRKRRLRKLWKRNMHLNHWEKDSYESAFENSGLQVEGFSDITENVIKGFKRYPLWLKTMQKRGFFNDLLMKVFYSINVILNIRLLKNRRQYAVFNGSKG